MTAWLRRLVPLACGAAAVFIAALLAPLSDRAWAPTLLPALVAGTWATGWAGGVLTLLIGIAGAFIFIHAPLWQRPAWTTVWLAAHLLTIVATDAARRARNERTAARRVQREQAARAVKVVQSRRADFLAHASDVLASSRDYETTLAAVATLAVPQIADICVVDIVNDQGEFVPLAVAHVDPHKVELVRELRRLYPLDVGASYGPPRVLRTGQSVIYTELPDTAMAESPIHPSELRVALALGICSTMAVPLLVGGRRLGVISLATTDSGRRFVASDLKFAEDLAHRAAIAIDAARPS